MAQALQYVFSRSSGDSDLESVLVIVRFLNHILFNFNLSCSSIPSSHQHKIINFPSHLHPPHVRRPPRCHPSPSLPPSHFAHEAGLQLESEMRLADGGYSRAYLDFVVSRSSRTDLDGDAVDVVVVVVIGTRRSGKK